MIDVVGNTYDHSSSRRMVVSCDPRVNASHWSLLPDKRRKSNFILVKLCFDFEINLAPVFLGLLDVGYFFITFMYGISQ